MDIFNSKSEVKDRWSKGVIGSIRLLRLNSYGLILFQCSCDQEHVLNCQNKYYTMNRIKGFFSKKTISEYSFHGSSRENENRNIPT